MSITTLPPQLAKANSVQQFAEVLAEFACAATQSHGVRVWVQGSGGWGEVACAGRGLGLSEGALAAEALSKSQVLQEGMFMAMPFGSGVLEFVGASQDGVDELNHLAALLGLALEGVQAREARRGSGRIAETVEDLVRRLGGSLDLGVVLPKTSESAALALGFQRAFVGLFSEFGEQGARTGEIFTYGFAREFSGGIGVGPKTYERLIVLGEAIRFERTRDANTPLAQGLAELNPEAAVMAPLRARGRPLGLLYVDSLQAGAAASEDDGKLVLALAEQAALAIDNARLYSIETRKRVAAETLREVGAELARSLHLSDTLNSVLNWAGRLFKVDAAAVYELQSDGRVLKIGQAVGLPSEYVLRVQAKIGAGVTGRAVAQRQTVVAHDINAAKFGGGSRYTRKLLAKGKYPYRGVVGSPLLTRAGVFGVLTLYWNTPVPLDEDDLALVDVFASQVALAIENARLYEEEQRQEREAAVLLNVSRLLGEDQSDEALNEVLRLCILALNAGRGLLVLFDDSGAIMRSFSYQLHKPAEQELETLQNQLGRGPRPLSRRYCLPVAGSGLIMPLIGADDQLLGYVYADDPDINPPGDRVLQLARSVVDQISLTLTRERLLVALAREEARYRQLAEGAHDLIISANTLGEITYANPAAIRLLEPVTGPLVTSHLWSLVASDSRLIFDDAWQAALTGSAGGRAEIVLAGYHLEIRLSRVDTGQGLLMVARDMSELQGLLEEMTRRGQALEAATSRQSELRTYLTLFTQAQEEERKRISRELHDDTAQVLIATNRRVGRLARELNGAHKERVSDIQQDLNAAIESVRRFARNLRPSVLDDLGLLPALEWLASQAQTNTRLEISGNERRLSSAIELTVFRLVQEALNNVDKHAEANSAAVRVSFKEEGIWVRVTDDGKGLDFKQAEAKAQAGHLGLIGLRERVTLAGGELFVESVGEGTTLIFHLPGS